MAELVAKPYWPALRPDLALYPGPLSGHGSPTWTLHDPARHRFFRLGWLEFEIVSRWRLGGPAPIAEAINQCTPIATTPDQVAGVARFFQAQDLTVADQPAHSARLANMKKAAKPSWWMWLLKNYLFIRFTVLRPDRFLTRLAPHLSWLGGRNFLYLTGGLMALAIYLIWRQWALFRESLVELASLEGVIIIGISLAGVKAAHEFGHAVAAKSRGCRVPAMGVALMCFFPVCWTDTTEAWKLKRHRDRLAIDGAGLAVEFFIAALASIAWSVLPPGGLKSAAYVLASTTWLVSLAVNVSPFLRYDGYYFLSDWLGEPQLQSRSFALARWKLREVLFGWGDPPPEYLPPKRRRLLLAYAYATWVYRFFLFLGIALLVYHLFFKILGIALMTVEIVWFLAAPVVKEATHWAKRRKSDYKMKHIVTTALAAAILVAIAVIPWRGSVSCPGILLALEQNHLHTPVSARVVSLEAANGQRVSAGQVIMRLSAPELDYAVASTSKRIAILRDELESMSQDRALMNSHAMVLNEIQGLQSQLEGFNATRSRLVIRAPFQGIIRDLPLWLAPAIWVTPGEPLGTLVGLGQRVEVFVAEHDLARLAPGAEGKFYPLGGRAPTSRVRLNYLDLTAVRDLNHPSLASSNGGPVAVAQGEHGTLAPERSLYRGWCAVPGEQSPPRQSMAGMAVLQGKPESFASAVWRNTVGMLIRESSW